MKPFKKLVACILAATVVVSSALTASAATASPTTAPTPVTRTSVSSTIAGVKKSKVNTNKSGTATVVKLAKNTKKTIKIPATVTVDGISYKVTSLKSTALKNSKKVTTVYLGSNVKSIGKNVFSSTNAKKLKKIVINGTKSITINKKAFGKRNTSKMVIKVSKKMSSKEYKKLKKQLKNAGFKGKIKR